MLSLRPIFRFSKPRRGAWACICTGLALAAIWWVSLGSTAYTTTSHVGVAIHSGTFQIIILHAAPRESWPKHGAHWTWPHWQAHWFPTWNSDPRTTDLTIPLWPPALILLAYGLLRLNRLREIPAHLCTHCRYDRRGIPASAPCPECGSAPAVSPTI